MYAKGMSTRDIQELLTELYGIDVSPETISVITDKVWPLVESSRESIGTMWQNRPLASVYAMLYLDAIHIKLKRDGRIDNVAIYNVLGVDLDGHREILGHSRRTSGRCGLVTAEKVPTSGSRSSPTCKIAACKMCLLPPSMV
jgi:transposase-like protein